MKNIKYLLFVFVCLFMIENNFVRADDLKMNIKYHGCCELNAPLSTLIYDSEKFYYSQTAIFSSNGVIYACNDQDFSHWMITAKVLHNDIPYIYTFCDDNGISFKKISECSNVSFLKNGDFEKYVVKLLFTALSGELNISNMEVDFYKVNSKGEGFRDDSIDNYKKNSCPKFEKFKNISSSIDNSCVLNLYKDDCVRSNCVWNNDYVDDKSNNLKGFCSPDGLVYLKCGDAYDIPEVVPKLTSYSVTLLKTVVPIILIIVSIVQLLKAISSSKEDEIKKAQSSLIKKIIASALVFFVVTIVQFVMLRVTSDDTEKGNLSSCLSCFLNGTSKCGASYYKDGYGNCYYVKDNSKFTCEIE